MKTGVIIRCYKLTEFLERVILNYKDADKIIVANFPFGNYSEEDNTATIAKKFSNVTLLTGNSPKQQAEVFELAQKELLDCDVVFISDADEFLLKGDRQRCIDVLSMYPGVRKIECMVIDYSKPDATEAFSQRTHMPVVAFKPPVNFSGTRWCDGESKRLFDMHMHHFGYCIKDLNWKFSNLWYPAHSADNIMCTMKRKMTPPKELEELLKS